MDGSIGTLVGSGASPTERLRAISLAANTGSMANPSGGVFDTAVDAAVVASGTGGTEFLRAKRCSIAAREGRTRGIEFVVTLRIIVGAVG